METSINQNFDEAARFVLYSPEFQNKIKQIISESPDTDEHEILFLLIEEARKRMDFDLKTEEGRKATQKLVKKDLLVDIRRIFKIVKKDAELISQAEPVTRVEGGVSKKIHQVVPEAGVAIKTPKPETPVLVPEVNKEVILDEQPGTTIEKLPDTLGKLFGFVLKIQRLKHLASQGDPKTLWTARFKKEGISLDAETKGWKDFFDLFIRNPIPESFYLEYPGLKALKVDYQRLQELTAAVKDRYLKKIAPIAISKLGRENINPYRVPDFYKLSLEEVVNFIKGERSVQAYLESLFEVYKYTPNAFDKRNVPDILKK